eukprot:g1226.t1
MDTIDDDGDDMLQLTSDGKTLCPLCLSLLSENNLRHFSEAITSALNPHYEFIAVTNLTILLPTSIRLRCLSTGSRDVYNKLKEILKKRIASLLKENGKISFVRLTETEKEENINSSPPTSRQQDPSHIEVTLSIINSNEEVDLREYYSKESGIDYVIPVYDENVVAHMTTPDPTKETSSSTCSSVKQKASSSSSSSNYSSRFGYKKRRKQKHRRSVYIGQLRNYVMTNCTAPCPMLADTVISPFVQVKRPAFYVYGRYRKLVRGLSHSPWNPTNEVISSSNSGDIDELTATFSSVEDGIAGHLRAYFKPDDMKFASSGREDVDVRMLGTGRPFVFKIINSKKIPPSSNEILDDIQKKINERGEGLIEVMDLRLASPSDIDLVTNQDMIASKCKTYFAVVWVANDGITETFLKNKIDIYCRNDLPSSNDESDSSNTGSLEIVQKTPLRVLHRRSAADRKKTIFWMQTQWLTKNYFTLTLKTSSGTYIKEFVNGDLGRTRPSIGDLLGGRTVDLLQLDVIDVQC